LTANGTVKCLNSAQSLAFQSQVGFRGAIWCKSTKRALPPAQILARDFQDDDEESKDQEK
jgi:hypothetical protein